MNIGQKIFDFFFVFLGLYYFMSDKDIKQKEGFVILNQIMDASHGHHDSSNTVDNSSVRKQQMCKYIID